MEPGPRLVCMPALRLREDPLHDRNVYARLTLVERLEYVDGAIADYKEVVRQTPMHRRAQTQRALLPFFVALRQQRNWLRQEIARQARSC